MSDHGAQFSLPNFTMSSLSQLLKQAIKDETDSRTPPPGYNQNSLVSSESLDTRLDGVEQMCARERWQPHTRHLPPGYHSQVQFAEVEENPDDNMLEAWLFPVRGF